MADIQFLINVANNLPNQYSREVALAEINAGGDPARLESLINNLAGYDVFAKVGTEQIAALAVETAQIAANAVTSAKILDGTILAADIANGVVTGAKILDRTIKTVDQGFGTWKTAANGGWSGNTFTLTAAVSTGCGVRDDTFNKYTTGVPTTGNNVEFADFLAISGECGLKCANNANVPGCLDAFFTFV